VEQRSRSRTLTAETLKRQSDLPAADFPILSFLQELKEFTMVKWNWLKGFRCLAGISATLVVSSAAFAGEAATQIPSITNPDAVFSQTSHSFLDEVGCAPKCGADGCGPGGDGCGCKTDGCDGGCGSSSDMFGLCCDQEEFKLFEGVEVGGWIQVGYTSQPTAFNSPAQSKRVMLNQGWIYLDKAATSECGEWGWGYHADFIYGADATNTQSFGNNPGQFDIDPGFQHGSREAWAIPQLYAEVTNGDWTVKAGHFYTLHGYEVVQATGNFFFTHAYTMNYAEPFTHTGAIVTYALNDTTDVYAGWTLGFDTGFDQSFGGNNFIGGFSHQLTDDLKLTYIASIGDFGTGFGLVADGSFAQSVVLDYQINEKLNYVFHSDVLRAANYDTVGVNQYLIYQLTDCVSAGTRVEWWKAQGASINAATVGLNIKPHANVTVRPEYRYDWSPSGNTNKGLQTGVVDQSQGTFAIDVVVTF